MMQPMSSISRPLSLAFVALVLLSVSSAQTPSAKRKTAAPNASDRGIELAENGHCDQAVRATYLARAQGLMGTVGVLNLSTAAHATHR